MYDIDYDETFTLVVKMNTVRTLIYDGREWWMKKCISPQGFDRGGLNGDSLGFWHGPNNW
jgi:hypothetical protein